MKYKYQPVTEEVIHALKEIVGEKYVKTDADVLDRYKTDEETDAHYHRLPEAAVWPASAQEIAEIMKLANKYHIPVTPRSAGTSVSCGAVPAYHGIVLLMERSLPKRPADALTFKFSIKGTASLKKSS